MIASSSAAQGFAPCSTGATGPLIARPIADRSVAGGRQFGRFNHAADCRRARSVSAQLRHDSPECAVRRRRRRRRWARRDGRGGRRSWRGRCCWRRCLSWRGGPGWCRSRSRRFVGLPLERLHAAIEVFAVLFERFQHEWSEAHREVRYRAANRDHTEDEEVVVIDREDRRAALAGKMSIRCRGTSHRRSTQRSAPNIEPKRSIAGSRLCR